MGTKNSILMTHARESLSGKWGLAIGTYLLFYILIIGVQFIPILGIIASLIFSGPLLIGLAIFTLNISRNQDPQLPQIFNGFIKFTTGLGAYLLMIVFIVLWSLLLIIPGIIAAISYSQTFYIIAEDDNIGAMEAINKSKQMMYGHKWKFFRLELRFIGWALLCILTLGIGFLWLIPYIWVSTAKFYDDIKTSTAQ